MPFWHLIYLQVIKYCLRDHPVATLQQNSGDPAFISGAISSTIKVLASLSQFCESTYSKEHAEAAFS